MRVSRLLKYVWITFIAVFAVIAIVLVLLTTSPGEQLTKQWLEGKLTSQTGTRVSIGEFKTNLRSQVELSRLTLHSDSATGYDTLLRIDDVRIGFSLFDLLSRKIRLRALMTDGMDIRVALDSLGAIGIPVIDLPDRQPSRGVKSLPVIQIDTLSFTNIGGSYSDSRIPLTVGLHGAVVQAIAHESKLYYGEVRVDSICVHYYEMPLFITDMRVGVQLNYDTVKVTEASARIAGLDWKTKGYITGPDWKQLAFTMSLQGNPEALLGSVVRQFELPKMSVDELMLQAEIAGNSAMPEVVGHLKAQGVDVNDVQVQSASLTARFISDTLFVDSLMLSMLGGALNGKGNVVIDRHIATRFALSAADLNVAEIWKAVYGEPSPFIGVFDGEISIAGWGNKISDWQAEVDLEASGMRYRGHSIPDLQSSLSLIDEAADLTLRHGNDVITASAQLADDRLSGHFRIDIPDVGKLARFFNQPELAGCLKADGNITGTLSKPAVEVSLAGSRILYRNFPLDTLSADLHYHDNILSINNITISGEIQEIDTAHALFNMESLGGGFRYTGQWSGSIDSLFGTLTAESKGLHYEDFVADSVSTDVEFTGRHIMLKSCNIFSSDLLVEAQGTYDMKTETGAIDVSLWSFGSIVSDKDIVTGYTTSGRVCRGEVSSSIAILPNSRFSCSAHGRSLWIGLINNLTGDTLDIDGRLDFDLSLDKAQNDFAGKLSASVRSIHVGNLDIDSLIATASLDGELLTLDNFNLFAVGQNLAAEASLRMVRGADNSLMISDQSDISGILSMDHFDLAAFQSLVVPEGVLSGTASARIAWHGNISAPRSEGWIKLENGRFRFTEQSSPMEQVSIQATLSDFVLSIDSAGWYAAGIPVSLNGSVSARNLDTYFVNLSLMLPNTGSLSTAGLLSTDSLDIRIAANSVDLSVFRPFLKNVDSLAGTLNSDVYIFGKAPMPEIQGSLTVSDVQLFSPEYYSNITKGHIKLSFDKHHVVIDSVDMNLNGGSLQLAGNITHDLREISDIDAVLSAHGLRFHDPELFLIIIKDARLTYAKRDDRFVLDGDVELGEARLTAKFRPQMILPWARSVETVDWELPELVSRTRLDIRVRESSDLWIDNNLARVRMHAELGIIGLPNRPNLSGMINVEEGYLLYLDRRFKVNKGTVFFSDANRFNPDIMLAASTQVSTYQRMAATKYNVYIQIEGQLDQLQVSLYSEPPLDKPDIAALLTLGATRTQLTSKGEPGGEGGTKNVLIDRAKMLTSQRVSSYVSSKVGSIFGFDEFTMEGNLFQFNQSWGPYLVASRRLTQRVELTYSTTVGRLNDQNVRLGYRLTPRLSLQGETDKDGRAAIDLKYGIKFK